MLEVDGEAEVDCPRHWLDVVHSRVTSTGYSDPDPLVVLVVETTGGIGST